MGVRRYGSHSRHLCAGGVRSEYDRLGLNFEAEMFAVTPYYLGAAVLGGLVGIYLFSLLFWYRIYSSHIDR